MFGLYCQKHVPQSAAGGADELDELLESLDPDDPELDDPLLPLDPELPELPELEDEPLLLEPDDWLLTLLDEPLELLDWLDWLELLPELRDELLGEEPVVPDEDEELSLSDETLDPLGTLEPLGSDELLLPLDAEVPELPDEPEDFDEPLLDDPDEPLLLLRELGDELLTDEPTVPDDDDESRLSDETLEPLGTLLPLGSDDSLLPLPLLRLLAEVPDEEPDEPLLDEPDEPELLLRELSDELLGDEPVVPDDDDGWLSEDALDTDEPEGSLSPLERLDPLESLDPPLRED